MPSSGGWPWPPASGTPRVAIRPRCGAVRGCWPRRGRPGSARGADGGRARLPGLQSRGCRGRAAGRRPARRGVTAPEPPAALAARAGGRAGGRWPSWRRTWSCARAARAEEARDGGRRRAPRRDGSQRRVPGPRAPDRHRSRPDPRRPADVRCPAHVAGPTARRPHPVADPDEVPDRGRFRRWPRGGARRQHRPGDGRRRRHRRRAVGAGLRRPIRGHRVRGPGRLAGVRDPQRRRPRRPRPMLDLDDGSTIWRVTDAQLAGELPAARTRTRRTGRGTDPDRSR